MKMYLEERMKQISPRHEFEDKRLKEISDYIESSDKQKRDLERLATQIILTLRVNFDRGCFEKVNLEEMENAIISFEKRRKEILGHE